MADYLELVQRLRGEHGTEPWQINPAAKTAADAIEEQAKRIAELEAALKPFADEAQFFVSKALNNHLAAPDRLYLTIGQFRAARKVLGEKE